MALRCRKPATCQNRQWRLASTSFGVTEPNSGSDTTKLQTTAVRHGDIYVVNGQKIFISRVLQSDLMLLLARTTPLSEVRRRTEGSPCS